MADSKKRDDLVIDLGDDKRGDYDSTMRSSVPPTPRTPGQSAPASAVSNNPIIPVLSYCGSSILMTVTNKFVLSGSGYNLNFFLLCVQVSIQWEGVKMAADRCLVCGLRDCDPDLQIIWGDNIQRLQFG